MLPAVVLLALIPAAAGRSERGSGAAFQMTHTFRVGAGHVVREVAFREQSGVILLNRVTVPVGVKSYVDARIPGVAGARVWSWQRAAQPTSDCRRIGGFEMCTQGEEWCPMPRAVWLFRFVKLSGPAGTIRFDYLVAPPPRRLASGTSLGLGLAREPYIGVACPRPNSTACGRVGIAVWLARSHAMRIDATLAGANVRLTPPKAVGSYWLGFVHLPLRTMGLSSSWAGAPPKRLTLRLRVSYRAGTQNGTLHLGLHSGFG